ncbi:MAG: hypothetical protein AB8B56_21720 [Crocinitomicaceae bacterium]
MQDKLMISFIVLLVFVLVARVLNERASKQLSPEKKVELIDLFSKNRITSLIILIGIILLYFLVMRAELLPPMVTMGIYMGVLVIYIIFFTVTTYRKLKAHDFPDDYIKSYVQSAVVRMIGILVFFLLMI